MRNVRLLLPVLAVASALSACGAATQDAVGVAIGPEAPRPLDWAMLLPIETDGLLRVDLERVRRSPHRDSLQPVLQEIVGATTDDPSMRAALASLVERTDVVLIAFVPGDRLEERMVVLAQGRYDADEIGRLEESATGPGRSSRSLRIDGHRVWAHEGEDRTTAATQLRPDTLVITDDVDRIERLIARTRMASHNPRWPPAVRALVEATGLERATFGVALANRNFGPLHGDAMPISMAGTADADGPLDLELLLELGDPAMAAAAAMFLSAMVQELALGANGESFALGQLAQLARIEATGTRVRGSIHAEAIAAEQLVPGLMGLLRDGLSDERMPPLGSELPTPI